MDQKADAEILSRKLIHVIRQCIEEGITEPFASPFFEVIDEQKEPRLETTSRLPTNSLKALWNFADEYFDSLAHGFPEVFGLPTEVARQRLIAAVNELEAQGDAC